MPPLLETLAAELHRARNVTSQVVHHLVGTYGLTRDGVGAFLMKELVGLEDYEIDLILSPLFTPTLRDQAVFAELLGKDSVPRNEWPVLIQQLLARPTLAQLTTGDGQSYLIPLREVTIERYVQRLRLDATIPDTLFNLILRLAPEADRPTLKAVARRAVWDSEPRRYILFRYLTLTAGGDGYRNSDVVGLLKLVETYQPNSLGELLAQIPHWQQVLRQEISAATRPRPFFNERVQELHGGERDQRSYDNSRIMAKEEEQTFLRRLQAVLTA